MTMIEKVARAIQHCPFPTTNKDKAKAAIEAMREPSEGMCHQAMLTLFHENKGVEYSPFIGWKVMIDAALKEE